MNKEKITIPLEIPPDFKENIFVVEVSNPDDVEVIKDIFDFLKSMKGKMDVFEHLRKYFSENENEEISVGKIRESLQIKNGGDRHLLLVKYKGQIIGLITLVSNDKEKMVEFGLYIETDLQGKGIAGEICIPAIKDFFVRNYTDKNDPNENYSLVYSYLTENARKLLKKSGATFETTSNILYTKVNF